MTDETPNLPCLLPRDWSHWRYELTHDLGRPLCHADRVIPTAICLAVLHQTPKLLEPMGNAEAPKCAKILVGSYPKREANDPAIYARAITSVFAEVPLDVGKAAVDHITRHCKFLPTRAEVHEACQRLVDERHMAARVARMHIAEEERRREEAERQASLPSPEERAAHIERLRREKPELFVGIDRARARERGKQTTLGDSASRVLSDLGNTSAAAESGVA